MSDHDLAKALALVSEIQPALERNDRARLVDIVTRLVAVRAPMGAQWAQLASVAAGTGENALALQAMDLYVATQGGRPTAQFHKVSFLSMLGLWRDADALVRSLPETVPDSVSNAQSRGAAALNLGRIDEARQYLERVARLRPQSGFAWYSLAMTIDFAREPELADRLIAGSADMESAPPRQRVPYDYALGKAHADRGDHALAFEAFARGARLMKSIAAYDRDDDRADAERATEGYTADRITALAPQQHAPTDRTIFVTGLPRSGTTLVEQILTSHSAVGDGGETARMTLLANEIGGTSYSALARHVDAVGMGPAAQLWDHWLDEMFPTPGRLVDKTLNTTRFLGLAATLLPEAPLIWMTRDPLDCAWSCFRTNFSGDALPWSYDLHDIAAHFRLEDELLARWREILGKRLLVVPYEALVTEPDIWIRRILSHCGLDEEPQVFAPHENRRPVMTASLVQVRKPINRAAIGAAEPYRNFLAPFIEAYYGRA